jgi:hypothetical protein
MRLQHRRINQQASYAIASALAATLALKADSSGRRCAQFLRDRAGCVLLLKELGTDIQKDGLVEEIKIIDMWSHPDGGFVLLDGHIVARAG